MEKKHSESEVPKNINLMHLVERGDDFIISAKTLREFLSADLRSIQMSTRPPPKLSSSK